MTPKQLQSTARARSAISWNSGFSLAEAIVAVFILSTIASALTGALIYGAQATALMGTTTRANLLAEEGLEAARNIRDANFSNLVNGTFGLQIVSNQWAFSGSSDTTDIFTRRVSIATIDAVTRQVTSTVAWSKGTISLITYMGNTGLLNTQANNLTVNTSGNFIGGVGKVELRGITLGNIGSAAIVIDKVKVSWTNSARKISQVVISATTVWSSTGPGTPTGTQFSGTELNNQNYTLVAGAANIPITRFRFTGNMEGPSNTFTIVFTMSDGSIKTVTVP